MSDISKSLLSALKKAAAGQATTMTPLEMDAFRVFSKAKSASHATKRREEEKEARKAFSDQDLKIHDYMYDLWSRMAELDYHPDFHDRLVIADAAVSFGISEDEAKSIYLAVEDAIFKKYP